MPATTFPFLLSMRTSMTPLLHADQTDVIAVFVAAHGIIQPGSSHPFLGMDPLWDVATGKERATLQGHSWVVLCVAFSPVGKTLASGSMDEHMKLWDLATGKERVTLEEPPLHDDYVEFIAFSPDGRTLASVSDDMIKLWDVASGKNTASFESGYQPVLRSVVFTPDSKLVALWSDGRAGQTGKLWKVVAVPNVKR